MLSILSNGNLLVAGGSSMSEYDAFGHLVRSFGTNGIASLGNLSEGALTVLSNGQILVGGTLTTSGAGGYISELAVEKFNADGTLDTSFGSGGMAVSTSEVGAFGPGYVLSALPSGDILVGGSALTSVNMDLVLAEFKSDGSVEGSFGTGGVMLANMGGYSIVPEAATLLPDGEILIGGWMETTVTNNLFLAKYQVDSVPAGYGAGTQTTTYTYDVKGKLVSVSTNGHVNATYTYDDAGNRVSETVGGVTTLYLTDTNNPTGYAQPIEAKSTATSKPITTWILGDRVFGQADTNGAMTYLLTDGHGSTRLLTNSSGTVTANFNYDAFGTATNFNSGMAATPFLFGGDSMYDPASGLYIHGDGTRERNGFWFIESDFGVKGRGNKQDPLSLHKYLYVDGNPVNEKDPSGHFGLLDILTTTAVGLTLTVNDTLFLGGGIFAIFNAIVVASDEEAIAEDAAIQAAEGMPDLTVQNSEWQLATSAANPGAAASNIDKFGTLSEGQELNLLAQSEELGDSLIGSRPILSAELGSLAPGRYMAVLGADGQVYLGTFHGNATEAAGGFSQIVGSGEVEVGPDGTIISTNFTPVQGGGWEGAW